jgi:peptidoglycan/LPS O-acetylase OafA/YrhL
MVMARDRSIEALRAFGVVSGLAGHSALPYLVGHMPGLVWSIQDGARSVACDFIWWWARCAQAQTFFFIAGFVAGRIRRSKSLRAFLKARAFRLGVPFLAAVVFVLPCVAAVWAIGWMASGRATWPEVWAWNFADPEIQANRLGPAHLWFLEDLLIVTGVFGFVGVPDIAREERWMRRVRVLAPTLAVLGAIMLAARPLILFEHRNSFVPDPLRIAYMATFFSGGVWLDAMFPGSSVHRFRVSTAVLLLGGAALAVAAVTTLAFEAPLHGINALAAGVAANAAGWLSIAGALAVASQPSVANSTITMRIAAAAYPIYLMHLPIVGAAHGLLASLPWSAAAKTSTAFAFVAVASWVISVAARPALTAADRARSALAGVRPAVWTTAAITFGVALRVVHYLRNPDVWHDEAALLVNVVERGYGRLLDPLTFHEAAPPLFLFAERWIALHFGDAEWTLRLVPLVASCAALVVFLPLARTVRTALVPVAVLLVASSNQLVGHSVEAKPYAVDVLVAAAVGSAFVATRAWSAARRAYLFAAAAPLVVWASYPGVFMIGGITCGLVPAVRREKRVAGWAGLAMLTIVIAVSVGLLLAIPVRAQRSPEIVAAWRDTFPAALTPGSLLVWLARAALGITDYCFRPIGGVLLVPISIGTWALSRRGDGPFMAMLFGPVVFAAVAGATQQYPFAGARVTMFMLPALSVLAAEGLAVLLASVRDRTPLAAAAIGAISILPPLLLAGREVLHPWQRPGAAAATAYVLAALQPGDLVASGAWEYRYYFRGIGTAFVRLDEQPWPRPTRRLWYVVNGATSERVRAAERSAVGAGYRVVDTMAWRDVSVVELSPP